MGKAKRNCAIVISSSDDEKDKDNNLLLKSGFSSSKSAPTRKNPKRAKRVSLPSSNSRQPFQYSSSSGFDEVKRICEEFDQGLTQFKVTPGSRSNKDLWVEKYTPSCLEELAVHKKKVEEVKIWFEERLKNPVDNSYSNVILISGQAGVGKSATIHAIARHLGVEVHEWNTPTPTIWQEHLHNSNSGISYMSKLDEFESFVEKIRKYGLISSSLTKVSPLSIILLIDDIPLVKGKVSYGRLQRCFHLLLQSVRLPTAILINEYGRSESAEHHSRYWEELQSSLQKAGACKVSFNPITANSIKKVLSKIRRVERIEVSDEQINLLANTSGGDIRHAITSLQYFSLKPRSMDSLSVRSAYREEKGAESSHLDDGVSLAFGKDATLSLFHALGKFLHNKRETGSLATSDEGAILLKEKFIRCPLKMDAPELVLSQAHGQATLIVDFLHENVLDFVREESIDDAWVIGTYLSDSDLLLASSASLSRNYEAENVLQSTAASIAVRGVLFGNNYPLSSRWHAIRRPVLWQVEQSLWRNKVDFCQGHSFYCSFTFFNIFLCQMQSERRDARMNTSLNNHTVIATEFKPALNWLGHKLPDYTANDADDDDKDDDEIEEW
ncbi:PREDICTED: cell cycle checkpoint protein RAD17-like isoform X1 [Erythranthe guttata]|uniref:cell cycle checkpoint protein RAD17-like isoform X1 n=2 Tax=Erythranthe guttata TaxID=4155 RepID=UPI00064D910B|nr:PREDICTED: cell cycle checkpoint protein RAD17-like isoform X1 [Erythranthe guttata]|eukprot:XP_012828856.1 PREDICTED: cell cycle checkpoint protein RAD17-like isoform X1 [Erythranthe guttata]